MKLTTGRPAKFALVATLMTVGLTEAPAAAESSLISPLRQLRTVLTLAGAGDGSGVDGDFARDKALDFGLFDARAWGNASVPGAWVSSGATQVSEILDDTIQATGHSYVTVLVTGSDASAGSTSSSDLLVTFSLAEASTFSLQGLLEAVEEGTAGLELSGPEGLLFEAAAGGATLTVPVNESGLLPAGKYTVKAGALTDVTMNEPIVPYHNESSFDFTLQLGPAVGSAR